MASRGRAARHGCGARRATVPLSAVVAGPLHRGAATACPNLNGAAFTGASVSVLHGGDDQALRYHSSTLWHVGLWSF